MGERVDNCPYFRKFSAYKAATGTEFLERSAKRGGMGATGSSRRGKLQLEKNEIPLIRSVLTRSH